jgi:hypothetical protein
LNVRGDEVHLALELDDGTSTRRFVTFLDQNTIRIRDEDEPAGVGKMYLREPSGP